MALDKVFIECTSLLYPESDSVKSLLIVFHALGKADVSSSGGSRKGENFHLYAVSIPHADRISTSPAALRITAVEDWTHKHSSTC